MKTKQKSILSYIVLHVAIFIFSLATLFQKKASGYAFFSKEFILYFAGVVGALFVYAIVWQQVLKRLPLIVAFANKVATIFWSFVFGVLVFHEPIEIKTIIGMLIVVVGVLLIITGDASIKRETKEDKKDEKGEIDE